MMNIYPLSDLYSGLFMDGIIVTVNVLKLVKVMIESQTTRDVSTCWQEYV